MSHSDNFGLPMFRRIGRYVLWAGVIAACNAVIIVLLLLMTGVL
jgi:hypothetical protein